MYYLGSLNHTFSGLSSLNLWLGRWQCHCIDIVLASSNLRLFWKLSIILVLYTRQIKKRCLRNFSDGAWNECLDKQDWNDLENCTSVNEMVDIFTINTEKALDEVAPYKSFLVKSNYKFGISAKTKELMRKRDTTRANIKKAKGNERSILTSKYKKLRNLVNQNVRRATILHNENKVKSANNEGEIWKIVNKEQ